MDTNKHVIDMMQIADSMFPTGLFAASNGLEKLFLDGTVTTPAQLVEYNKIRIKQQTGPCDCILLANAYRAAENSDHTTIQRLDTLSSSITSVREAREASARAGSQLARCVGGFAGSMTGNKNGDILDWWNARIQDGSIAGSYPVSFGICCQALDIGAERAVLMFLYSFVAGNVSAALRLGMIQHLEGQNVIHSLKQTITDAAKRYTDMPAFEIWQFAPHSEINQMRHEKMDAKMFIT